MYRLVKYLEWRLTQAEASNLEIGVEEYLAELLYWLLIFIDYAGYGLEVRTEVNIMWRLINNVRLKTGFGYQLFMKLDVGRYDCPCTNN